MEIKRLKDNQIRCALTEEEIVEMGFNIDDIIGNGEVTQEFMRVVLEKIEEQEDIDIGHISPMVRAELMPDHSMAITFGGISPEDKKNMINRIMEMMEELSGKEPIEQKKKEEAPIQESAKLAVEFNSIEEAAWMSKLFSKKEQLPVSSFYKMKEKYYLILEFEEFAKEEIKQFAFTIVEYENQRIATESGIAYIKEHGKCILKKDALLDLMQL